MYRNSILLLLSIVLLLVAITMSVQAQTARPDRISFYNVPADSGKYILHVDYADGREERHPQGTCTAGAPIVAPLNVYTATFVAEGCTPDIRQQLNLRWLGGCWFDFEHDPAARIETHGAYGTVTISGHYPQGETELAIPTGTISMTATMSETVNGALWTGNVEFTFSEPIGCVEPPQDVPAPPTATGTPTSASVPTETATPTLTPVATQIEATATPTEATSEPTETPTLIVVVDDFTPTPEPTSTPLTGSGNPPTGEDGRPEPVRSVYLPMVSR